MSGGPLVSICMPTFNGAPWLAAAMESALAQQGVEIELIVADDASTDATLAIAHDLAARDGRVRVHPASRHLGLAANWNRCMALARGAWVKFFAQDDLLAPDCVAVMLASGGASRPFVVCDRRVLVEGEVDLRQREWRAAVPTLASLLGELEFVTPTAVCRLLGEHPGINWIGEPCTVLMRRAACERAGGFLAGMIQLCDLEYWARSAVITGIARVPRELATFRIHPGGTTVTQAAGRQFRKDVLDPLVLYHQFAFAPEYAVLRETVGTRFLVLAERQLRRARQEARDAADPELRAEFAAVLAEYPKLARPLWQLWQRVCNHLPRR